MTTSRDIAQALDAPRRGSDGVPPFSELIQQNAAVVAVGDDGATPDLCERIVGVIHTLRQRGFDTLAIDTPHLRAYSRLNDGHVVGPAELERHRDIGGWHGTELIRAASAVGMKVVGVRMAAETFLGKDDRFVSATMTADHISGLHDGNNRVLFVGRREHVVPVGTSVDESCTVPDVLRQLGVTVDTIAQAGGVLGDDDLAREGDFYDAVARASSGDRPFTIAHAIAGQPVKMVHAPQVRVDGAKDLLLYGTLDVDPETAQLVQPTWDREHRRAHIAEARQRQIARHGLEGLPERVVQALAAQRDGDFDSASDFFQDIGDHRSAARALFAGGRNGDASLVIGAEPNDAGALRAYAGIVTHGGGDPAWAARCHTLAGVAEEQLTAPYTGDDSSRLLTGETLVSTEDARELRARTEVAEATESRSPGPLTRVEGRDTGAGARRSTDVGKPLSQPTTGQNQTGQNQADQSQSGPGQHLGGLGD